MRAGTATTAFAGTGAVRYPPGTMADPGPPTDPAADAARQRRLRDAFAAEELRSTRLALRVRLAIIPILAAWIAVENQYPEFLYFYPFLLLFALVGAAPLLLRRRGIDAAWVRYLFPLLDITLFTLMVMLQNPLEPELVPPQMLLRFGNDVYLYIFIAASAFSYSPRVVVWTGACAALAWTVATLAIYRLPDTIGWMGDADWKAMTAAERIGTALHPHFVNLGLLGRQALLFLLTGAALAVFVNRARRLVVQQAEAERQRANLTRYFSPNLVEELAHTDEPLGPTRQQQVAVLFADLVGFTRLAESMPPPAVIALLRDFHARMQQAIFAHQGTVDKYIGDAVMATFGTPRPGPADATNALRCAGAMRAAVAEWNAARAARGEAACRVGIGVHFGPVVLGDIGGASRLEFAVLGDAVNVASRLERLTRELGAEVVVSDALVAAARGEGGADVEAVLSAYEPGPPATLRGRTVPVPVWVCR